MKEEELQKDKQKSYLYLLIIAAFISFLCGIIIPLSYPKEFSFDSDFLAACFSLAGVFMFSAALLYQHREYKLQLEVFKQSNTAQTSTSKSLEDQKDILLKQSNDQLLFNVIENFNKFKGRDEIKSSINDYYKKLPVIFMEYYSDAIPILHDDKTKIKLSNKIIAAASACYNKTDNRDYLGRYIIFAFNVFKLIDNCKIEESKEWFKPYFYNQFTFSEIQILFLARFYDDINTKHELLNWNYEFTKKLIEQLVKHHPSINIDTIDINELNHELWSYGSKEN